MTDIYHINSVQCQASKSTFRVRNNLIFSEQRMHYLSFAFSFAALHLGKLIQHSICVKKTQDTHCHNKLLDLS
jgi:hypothetical protein